MPAAASLLAIIPSLVSSRASHLVLSAGPRGCLVSSLGSAHLITQLCIPEEGLSVSSPTLPAPILSIVYNKLLSCIQKRQALNRIWLCCLELFTTYFGLSRQGHKYTVNLPDSKNSPRGPKRLTTCGNRDPIFPAPASCPQGQPSVVWMWGLMLQLPLLGGISFPWSLPNTWWHPWSFLALGKDLSIA